MNEEGVAAAVALPRGVARGNVVAVLEIGETRLEESLVARSTPAVQRSACATGADMGRYLTEVKAAAYLTRPVPMRGRPGVFDVDVPEASLPPPAALPPRRWTIGDGDDSG